jgi:hypothetical protein
MGGLKTLWPGRNICVIYKYFLSTDGRRKDKRERRKGTMRKRDDRKEERR